MMPVLRWLSGALLIALMALGSVALWIAIPLGWILLASHLTDTSAPTLGPYLVALVGIPVSMFFMARLLYRLDHLYAAVMHRSYEVREHSAWLRSMRGERGSRRPRTVLDTVMMISVSLAVLAFLVWFSLFAHFTMPGG